MTEQKDPTKWIALSVAVLSLIISGATAYFQFSARHDFRAFPSSVRVGNQALEVAVLLVNRGNQVESLQEVTADDLMGCDLGSSGPNVIKAGEAAAVAIRIDIPRGGFKKLETPAGYLVLNLDFRTIDSRTTARSAYVITYEDKAFYIKVDAKGRPIDKTGGLFDRSEDLLRQDTEHANFPDCSP
jgi:hypothetical protein